MIVEPVLAAAMGFMITIHEVAVWFRFDPGTNRPRRLLSRLFQHQEQPMNPRNESGYDPVGDPRTGRPPLPHERERRRQAQPDEINPSEVDQSRASWDSAGDGGYTEDSSFAGSSLAGSESSAAESPSMMDELASGGARVGAQVSAAASAAMEQGSTLVSTASTRAQGIAGELIGFAKRKPLATLLGVAIVGMLIGMFRRRRG
jgi:hypothetical protein